MRWTIIGGLERAINVWVDADRLAAYQIPITAVRDAVERQNANIPGGNVTGRLREQTLRTMGRITDPKAFNELVIATRQRLAHPRARHWLGGGRDQGAALAVAPERRRPLSRWNAAPVRRQHRGRDRRRQREAGRTWRRCCRRM